MKIELIEKNLIFETISGSKLYGFSNENSDTDRRGVFIPSKEYLLGLKNIEQFIDEKNDRVLYNIKKLFLLLIDNNPNIIELLYVPDKHIIFKNEIWERIIENRHLFLSKRSKFSFTGYAYSQLKRIKTHKKWIDDPLDNPPEKENYINTITCKLNESSKIIQNSWVNLEIKEIKKDEVIFTIFKKDEYDAAHQRHLDYLNWKKNRNEKRSELEKKFSYDTKHATHLIRLMKMGLEILKYKEIYVDRKEYGDSEFFKEIRNGKYSYDELLELTEELNNQIEEEYKISTLRNGADQKKIDELLIEILENYL